MNHAAPHRSWIFATFTRAAGAALTLAVLLVTMTLEAGSARAQAVVATVPVGTSPASVAANPVTHKVYVVNDGSHDVTVIDEATNSTTTLGIYLGTQTRFAINPVTNKLYVIGHLGGNVAVIDGATNNTIMVPTGTYTAAIGINPVTNKIYVANSYDATVTVIDGATNNTETVSIHERPGALNGIAVNPVTNKIYIAEISSQSVTVIDGNFDVLTTTIAVSPYQYAIAANTVTNKIYVVNQQANTVTVIDGATNSTTTVGVGHLPDGLAINEATNKIYVSTADGVTVVDGATNTVTASVSAVGPMAINPTTNKIYVANTLGNTVTVIDGATNSTAAVGVGVLPSAVAVDPTTNKIYVANKGDNTMTVIDDGPTAERASLQAVVAGSSAMWRQLGQAMAGMNPQQNCAWTRKQNVDTYLYDTRPTADFQDFGDLWVVWTPGTGGTCAAPALDSQVYVYISADSTVGNRCLFAQPQCTLRTTYSAGAAGANLLPGTTDTPLPQLILNTFNGASVTIAASDILPADAKFAINSTRAKCGPLASGTQFVGLGYGPLFPGGTAFNSSYSTNSFHIADFYIYGYEVYSYDSNSPPLAFQIPAYTVTPVGAAPVLVLVNTTNRNPAGFGDPRVKNVNRTTLTGYLTGFLGRTSDILPQSFDGTDATHYGTATLIPEPLSGAYRVMEHTIANNKEMYKSQEYGNCGADGSYTVNTNPLNLTRTIGGTNSYRKRVIGTGEMVSTLQTVQDSIGYAFWSSANFNNTTNLKYLTVDGVDPLLDTYGDGAIPQSGNSLLPNVTLSHVKDGSYPLWSMLRLVTLNNNSAATAAAQNLASAAQNMVSFGPGATNPDFVPYSQMNVFHAHYAPVGVDFNSGDVASDGNCGAPEAGSDVGGMVFTLQAGGDYCVLKGNYGNAVTGIGPTNTATFGLRQ